MQHTCTVTRAWCPWWSRHNPFGMDWRFRPPDVVSALSSHPPVWIGCRGAHPRQQRVLVSDNSSGHPVTAGTAAVWQQRKKGDRQDEKVARLCWWLSYVVLVLVCGDNNHNHNRGHDEDTCLQRCLRIVEGAFFDREVAEGILSDTVLLLHMRGVWKMLLPCE